MYERTICEVCRDIALDEHVLRYRSFSNIIWIAQVSLPIHPELATFQAVLADASQQWCIFRRIDKNLQVHTQLVNYRQAEALRARSCT